MADGIGQELGSPGNLVSVIQMPLQDVIALLAEAQLFFGNDTGMLNLSAACGTPECRLVRSSSFGLGGEQLSPNSSDISRSRSVKQWSRANSAIRVLQAANHLELLDGSETGS